MFFFFDILIPFEKIFPGNIWLFRNSDLKVPKFKEHVLISVITPIEVRGLLFTLLQVITIYLWHTSKNL